MSEISHVVWVDLETEGLDPEKHAILEIAMSVAPFTDPFNARPLFHCVVGMGAGYDPVTTQFDPGFVRLNPPLHPTVLEMHTKNGLFEACRNAPVIPTAVRAAAILSALHEIPNCKGLIFGGSTVHFDRRFLEERMPEVTQLFHHRHFDVSTLKLFCMSMGMPQIPKGEAHRAREDVLESIEHGRLCTQWLRVNAQHFPETGGLL